MPAIVNASPTVLVVLTIAVLTFVLAAAFCLLSIVRKHTAGDQDELPETLTNLEEMVLRGDITMEEFRSIQASSNQQHAAVDRSTDE